MRIKTTFGTGDDTVVMTDTAPSIPEYIERLRSYGWEVEAITKIEVLEDA